MDEQTLMSWYIAMCYAGLAKDYITNPDKAYLYARKAAHWANDAYDRA